MPASGRMRIRAEPHRNEGIHLHREAVGRRLIDDTGKVDRLVAENVDSDERRAPAVAFTENRRATGSAVATDPAARSTGAAVNAASSRQVRGARVE